jgi:hypothetical protein
MNHQDHLMNGDIETLMERMGSSNDSHLTLSTIEQDTDAFVDHFTHYEL